MITSNSPDILFLCETNSGNNGNVYNMILNVGILTNIHRVNCVTSGVVRQGFNFPMGQRCKIEYFGFESKYD